MKIVIFTSNGIRHKFFANSISKENDVLVISECNNNDSVIENESKLIQEHFKLRLKTEQKFFPGNDFFQSKTLPILYKEVNLPYVYDAVKKFNPDLMLVFGSSIIKNPLLELLPSGRFLNLHLGLSPYYRGSGTNFWPFVNNELEFIGSTILYLDSGIDTGDIVCHIRSNFEISDTVHSIGCKVIRDSVKTVKKIINMIQQGYTIPRKKQWKIESTKYYKISDFNEEILKQYYQNLENGVIENFIHVQRDLKLIPLE